MRPLIRAARGFTLAEIAIVLVIIMTIASFLAPSFFDLDRGRRNDEAIRQMDDLKRAVVHYASVNRTAPFAVEVNKGGVAYRSDWPGGRPYLPCPDITGDGLEDRLPLDLTAVRTVTLSMDYATAAHPLNIGGGCASSRGVFPWRTLGVHGKDPWGNRHTYRVAAKYSSALRGFDSEIVADSYHDFFALSDTVGIVELTARFAFDSFVASPSFAAWPANALKNYDAPAVVCTRAPCPEQHSSISVTAGLGIPEYAVVAGAFADISITVRMRRGGYDGASVPYPAGVQTDGMPFVIVSHGRNGYGAVRGDSENFECRPFPASAGSLYDERQNAFWEAGVSTVTADGETFECAAESADLPEGGFVAGVNQGGRPAGAGSGHPGGGYDDIVGWMSLPELVGRLSDLRALPAPRQPPAGVAP